MEVNVDWWQRTKGFIMTAKTSSSGCCTPITDAGLTEVAAGDMARRFKALGDPARLRLLSLIASNEEMCVCDLTEPLGLSQPTVSHHLKVLASAGLVQREQRGKWAYFSVDDTELDHLAHTLVADALSPETVETPTPSVV